MSDYEIDKLLREKLIEEEQRKKRDSRKNRGNVEIEEADEVGERKMDLKTAIFMTQVKLNTEGKRFKGRKRVLLEDCVRARASRWLSVMLSAEGAGASMSTRVASVVPGSGVSEKVTVPSESTERIASAAAGSAAAASSSAGRNLCSMIFSSECQEPV